MRNTEEEASFLPDHVGEDNGGCSSHINRLPDELLLLIFNKLEDARCLCKCNLVSKRFSAIIPRIHSVSLTIPPRYSISSISNQSQHDGNNNLPKKLVGFLVDSIFFRPFRFVQATTKCLPRQFNGPLFRAAVESLKKFRNMQRLRIQIPPVQRQDSLRRWHAEFGNDDENICVVVFASSLREADDDQLLREYSYEGGGESEESGWTNHNSTEMYGLTDGMLRRRIATANQCYSEASWRNHILGHVVEEHGRGRLERAEMIDSEGVGSLLITICSPSKEEDRGELKGSGGGGGYAKVWHFPELGCPSGWGFGVSIFAIRHTDEVPKADEERLNSLMDGAFHDHDHDHDLVYKEILKRRYDDVDVIPITLNLNVRH